MADHKKFYELVNRTATQHVCTYEDVIHVCSKWFTVHKGDISELDRVLDMYGSLRDLGHAHNMIINSLSSILDWRTASPVTTSVTVQPMRSLGIFKSAEWVHKRWRDEDIKDIVKDDIRMIRDD